jgi:hypothetical protein
MVMTKSSPTLLLLAVLTALFAAVPVMAAPKPTKSTALPVVKRKPNFVVGRCINSSGKPLSNVRIRVFGTTQAGERTSFDTKTNANGLYSIPLPKGNYYVGWALYDVAAPAGPPYSLPLYPVDGSNDHAPSGAGIVENFVLKIRGLITPLKDKENSLSYYGGAIRVFGGALADGNLLSGYSYNFPSGSSVELTLIPQGKLIDGSVGNTLVRRKAITGSGATFLDIPIGQYQVSAKLFSGSGAPVPLQVAVARLGSGYSPTHFTPASEDFRSSGKLYFPSAGDSISVLSMTGVGSADVYVRP